ncbi:ArsC/Spx/MgsR family protein [uncultured Sulfitobacter sp.]|uniref:arsenate reductase family protein n=1 Tax=uncultured Sulfitobacter sp. TaxID=191468 RepID=UPI00260545E5|nr:ArsC/Spx/MgsR family protein [uncultured Sulfitobacter sp.]
MVEIFGLKNCDTCRKAVKALPDAQLRDVRVDGVPDEVMAQAFKMFGDRLLNTRSTTWRGLDEAARSESPLALIAQHPALMKRPLIKAGDTLFLGWSTQTEADVKAAS